MPALRPGLFLLCFVLLGCTGVRAQVLPLPAVAESPPAATPATAPLPASLLSPPAPVAERRPFVVKSPHGDRDDEFHWLRDDDPRAKRPEVLRHLEAENRHSEAVLAPLKALRERLYQEMVSRVKPDDSSVPVFDAGWWLWRQYEPGLDHPKLMRRRGSPAGPDPAARAEVLLDLPQQALVQRHYSLGQVRTSPDGQWLAWTEDVIGRGAYDLYIQNVKSRRFEPERIRGVLEGFAWAADSRTLFYVRQDVQTLHSGVVMRHRRGSDAAADEVVHDEADKTLFVGVRLSASRRQVLIDIHGTHTTELRAVPAEQPGEAARVVLPRRAGVRTEAEHIGRRWLLRTNDGAPNYRLVEAPEAETDDRAHWRTLVPARDAAALEGVAVFEQGLALLERVQARRRVRVLAHDGRELRVVDGGEAATVALGENLDAGAARVQLVVQSMVRPPAIVEVALADGQERLRRQETLRGHDPALYRSQQVWVPSRDGQRIPVTLAWRPDRARQDGRAPLLIEAYGAYGDSYDPLFEAHRLPLLERGFVIAIAHVRGGAELGQAWYEGGRLANKPHSFDDFDDVASHLVAERWAAPGLLFAQGASAGGLLVGVAANRIGTRFRGLALDVPFVDVLTTMLDASLPLTANEWGEWGDPREKGAYELLLSYSPYDNVGARPYPTMLVTGALWDTRVLVHEPAKWVARLRERKTDRNPLLLHVEMNAGHAGAAGRLERPRHWARQHALFLALAGLEAAPSAAPPPAAEPAGLATGDVTRGIKLTR